jgi:hypothetical protein
MPRKTTIILEDHQYFYLLEKILELRKRNRKATLGSLIRTFVDKDMQVNKGKKALKK